VVQEGDTMLCSRLGAGLWLSIVLAIPNSAPATIVLQNDSRHTSIAATDLGCGFSNVTITPPVPFGAFVDSRSLPSDGGGTITVTQTSTVNVTGMSGSGSAAQVASPHFCGLSVFSIGFQVTSSTPYVFEATLENEGPAANTSLFLSGESGFIINELLSETTSKIVSHSGVLAPGSYGLDVTARSGPTSSRFDFHLAFVPEPATASLLALGVAALAFRGRSRAAARRGQSAFAMTVAS
jgi:hypothetical protein